jgi:type IV secretion system protein VirB10
MQDEMAAALASQIGQTSMQLLEKNMSIKPTLEIRPGYRFNIVVTKDMLFRGPYVQWR